MDNNIVKYCSRTFSEYKEDLVNMIKQTYPEIFKDFTDSSLGSLLIDLNAGIANNLSMNTDRIFMETQISHAQKKSSIFDHAKRLGFSVPGKRPSVTVVDFSIQIPVSGNEPNEAYYPTISPGAVVNGGGRSFETQDTIDFKSKVNSFGDHNRSIIPNLDSNGIIQSYTITKREIVINGLTKVHKRVINSSDVRPFFSLTLPDDNVIGIENVILLEGTSFSVTPPTHKFFEDYDMGTRYLEVDFLAQQRVFLEKQKDPSDADEQALKAGQWKLITRKFIKEYTPNGFCRLIFGAGDSETQALIQNLGELELDNDLFISKYLENTTLGEKLKPGHTLFVRYRVGGGTGSNLGKNVLTGLGAYNIKVSGPNLKQNQMVKRSLTVTNPIPAIGGRDELNVEEIRHLIKYNLVAKNRCVTLNDYMLQLFKMPGRFGVPFKVAVYKENNKVIISILNIDSSGKLLNESSSLLKKNIAEYLTEYRMINDFVEIKDGKIYNLAFNIEVFVEDLSDVRIANNIIENVKSYFSIRDNQMSKDIYMGRLEELILNIPGVINIINITPYNKVGGEYSINSMSLDLVDEETGEIRKLNNTIYSSRDSMFEIKYPSKDIRIFLRKISAY